MNAHFIKRERCPCCLAEDREELCRVPYQDAVIRNYLDRFYADVGKIEHDQLAGSDYALLECKSCGAIYQEQIPDGELSNRFYEEWIDPKRAFDLYEHTRSVASYAHLARSVETIIRHLGRTPSSLKLLDFGMGWGKWCMLASAFGCQSFGAEISPERIRYAEAHGIQVITYEDMTNHSFDCINAEQVFEHVPDPLDMLKYLVSALAPDGIMWIAVPDGGDIKKRLKLWDWNAPKDSERSLNAVAPLEHVTCYSHDVLASMAAKAGLRTIHVPAKPAGGTRGPDAKGGRLARLLGRAAGASSGVVSESTEFEGTNLFFTHA